LQPAASSVVVTQQQRRQLWLEAHFSGCSAFQSRSSFCYGSSGTEHVAIDLDKNTAPPPWPKRAVGAEGEMPSHELPTHFSGNPWQTDARNKFRDADLYEVQGVVLCPNSIYSSHPNSRLVKRRRVPTAAEQCGCTILRELPRRAANGSHSVAPSARNSVQRSSNMKKSTQRAERRRMASWTRTAATLSVCHFA